MASWFLPAEPGHSTIAAWARAVEEYWWERTQADQYFWFHRPFQRICEADPQIAGLWERVSKISAVGPHRIQHLGMLSAAPETAGAVDWSTTVFKLTYRYDQAAAGSDCLLRRPVGHEDPSGASEEVAGLMALQDSPSPPPRRLASLSVSTENLGDHVQIVSGLDVLSRFGLSPEVFLDRDFALKSAPGLEGGVDYPILLNG